MPLAILDESRLESIEVRGLLRGERTDKSVLIGIEGDEHVTTLVDSVFKTQLHGLLPLHLTHEGHVLLYADVGVGGLVINYPHEGSHALGDESDILGGIAHTAQQFLSVREDDFSVRK